MKTVQVALDCQLEPMRIDRLLGFCNAQLDWNDVPCWRQQSPLVRLLQPGLIRVFVMEEDMPLLPEPGRYRWEEADAIFRAVAETGADILACLLIKPRCLFPDLDPTSIEPTDEHAYFDLVRALVARYRSTVRYWEIDNEPAGGGGTPFQYTPQEYADRYVRLARVIRQVDPNARVGGPAGSSAGGPFPKACPHLRAMLDAAHVAGAPVDFLSWHDYHDDPAHIEQVAKELVELAEGMNPRPETIIDEWNVKLRGPHANPAFASCHVLETVRRMQKAGLDRACYYQLRDPIFSQEKLRHMLPAREAGKVSRQFERLPMHLGLFDRYGTMRPSFFAFQLLSRLSGFRLNVAAEEPLGVLAAHDPDRVLDVVLAWNASDQIVETELQFTGLAVGATVRWQRLDAQTDSNEELRRLRPQQELRLESPNPKVTFVLAPYEVTYWALIPDSQ